MIHSIRTNSMQSSEAHLGLSCLFGPLLHPPMSSCHSRCDLSQLEPGQILNCALSSLIKCTSLKCFFFSVYIYYKNFKCCRRKYKNKSHPLSSYSEYLQHFVKHSLTGPFVHCIHFLLLHNKLPEPWQLERHTCIIQQAL